MSASGKDGFSTSNLASCKSESRNYSQTVYPITNDWHDVLAKTDLHCAHGLLPKSTANLVHVNIHLRQISNAETVRPSLSNYATIIIQ